MSDFLKDFSINIVETEADTEDQIIMLLPDAVKIDPSKIRYRLIEGVEGDRFIHKLECRMGVDYFQIDPTKVGIIK
jgi:hypothetical protein